MSLQILWRISFRWRSQLWQHPCTTIGQLHAASICDKSSNSIGQYLSFIQCPIIAHWSRRGFSLELWSVNWHHWWALVYFHWAAQINRVQLEDIFVSSGTARSFRLWRAGQNMLLPTFVTVFGWVQPLTLSSSGSFEWYCGIYRTTMAIFRLKFQLIHQRGDSKHSYIFTC